MPECIVSRYAILSNVVAYSRYFMVQEQKWIDIGDRGARANSDRYRHKKNRPTPMSPLAFSTIFVGVQSPIIYINITEPAADDSKEKPIEVVSNEMNNTYQTVQTILPMGAGDGFVRAPAIFTVTLREAALTVVQVERLNSLEIETRYKPTDTATNYSSFFSTVIQSATSESTTGTENAQRRHSKARRQSSTSSTEQGDGGKFRDSKVVLGPHL